MTTPAEQVMLTVMTNNLMHAQCAIDDTHPCVVIWSGGAVEQIDAVVSAFLAPYRTALEAIAKIETPCMSRDAQDGFNHHAAEDAYRVELAKLILSAKQTAQSALGHATYRG